jgi:WD40 repeat protein
LEERILMFTLSFPLKNEYVSSLAYSPSGLALAGICHVPMSRGYIRIWDLGERKLVFADPPRSGEHVLDIAFVRDDATLAVRGTHHVYGTGLWILDVPTRQTRPLFDSGYSRCKTVVENGEMVVAASLSLTSAGRSIDVRQVDVSTGQETLRAQFLLNWQFSQSNNYALRPGYPVTVAMEEDQGRVVLLSPGRLPEEVAPHGCAALQFAPDGRALAVRTYESVRLWDVGARRITAEVVEPSGITAIAFSPDGRTLATGTNDGAVRFHDVATGQQRAAFDWQFGPIRAVACAPDGMTAAAGGTMGRIVVWDVDSA